MKILLVILIVIELIQIAVLVNMRDLLWHLTQEKANVRSGG